MTILDERQRRLAERVERRLWTYMPLRASGSRVEVTCHNHIAVLRGIVRSRTLKGTLEALARHVEGIREVRNELVCDTDLEIELARRLALDDGTRAFAHRLRARVLLGNVDLHGMVGSSEESEAVENVARSVPGVRRVVNHLRLVEVARPKAGPKEEPVYAT